MNQSWNKNSCENILNYQKTSFPQGNVRDF